MKRAYEELEREGIIYRRQGLGTFVADRGDWASREAKLKAAQSYFDRAVREAAEAGLARKEIEALAIRATRESLSRRAK